MSKPEFRCQVEVKPLAEQTDPAQSRWAFQYTVTIENVGDQPAQLVAREWHICDARGTVQQVRGLAVVGHQPVLKPGEHFEYTSWTRVATPHGSMKGTFFCMTEDAHPFDSPVPEFQLVFPGMLH